MSAASPPAAVAPLSAKTATVTWTAAPGGARLIALYDGHCRFCKRQAKQLERIVGVGRLELVSFQDDGVLARFPGVTYDACMQRMHIVRPDGRVFAAAEAVVRALALLPVVGWLAYGYYVPGFRTVADWAYRVIARNRYRIAGRTGDCHGGTCSLHR